MLLKHSEDQSSTLGQKEPSTSSLLPTCSYSAEIQELGTTLKNNNNFSKTCKTCGEIVLESEYLVHKKESFGYEKFKINFLLPHWVELDGCN